MDQIDLPGRMRIGDYAHHAVKIERALMPAPVQIESPVCGAGAENRLHVNVVARPAQSYRRILVTEVVRRQRLELAI
jgi:hypothetical protein